MTVITLDNTEIKQMDWNQFLFGVVVGAIAATFMWVTVFHRCY